METHQHTRRTSKVKERPCNLGIATVNRTTTHLKDTPRTENIRKLNNTVCQLTARTETLEQQNAHLQQEVISLQRRVNEIVTEELIGLKSDPNKREIPDGMYS
jgi:hypothetical protein